MIYLNLDLPTVHLRDHSQHMDKSRRSTVLTIVFRPPGEVTAADDVVEDEPDDTPRHVVRWSSRRDVTRASEHDRPVDVLQEARGVPSLYQIAHDGRASADEEEPHETVEELTAGELSRGADDAPNDRGCPEDSRARTAKAVLLVFGADIGDVGEHPGLDAQLHGSCNGCCNDLTPEHRPGPAALSDVKSVADEIEILTVLSCSDRA